VFDKRIMRGIFGSKTDEVAGDWRRLHAEELRNFTLHQMLLGLSAKEVKMNEACSTHGKYENWIQNFGQKM
jgi:hypothetical protein